VLLSVTDFDGLPVEIFVNSTMNFANGLVQIETLDVDNIVKDPNGVASDLMNVEIRSYEIRFTRGDEGTRVPTPLVRGIFGVAPAGGNLTYDGLPIMTRNQFTQPPLSDLFLVNGGVDTETCRTKIVMNLHLRFFGRTLSGDEVESAPAVFTIDFFP
jgi:hypothetical protein